MGISEIFLLVASLVEVALLLVVVAFFSRLRRSEELLAKLQDKQDDLLTRLRANAQLEQELVATFAHRQEELSRLDGLLAAKATELRKLLEQAQSVCRSPDFLREVVAAGLKAGKSPLELAKATGLSLDEVELLMERSRG